MQQIEMEKHVASESGPTVGYRYIVDEHRSIWCGEISRDLFEAEGCQALADDFGWFLVLYDDRQRTATVLAKAADQERGQQAAEMIAKGMAIA